MSERLAKLRTHPAMLWVGVALVAAALLALPFALAAITRLMSTPIRPAMCGFCEVARIATPSLVR